MGNPRTPPMLSMLSENWWVLALRGLLAVLFGFAALVLPLGTLEAVGRLFGVYAILEGALVVLIGLRGTQYRGAFLSEGPSASWPDWWPSPGLASLRSCSCTSSPSGRYSAASRRSSRLSLCDARSRESGFCFSWGYLRRPRDGNGCPA